ncbi:MAG: hypothetical protein LBG96_17625 [Tannerella sp.]|jgi:hypothetical protein|nr:hypothetical protein [Tannerella sp.]
MNRFKFFFPVILFAVSVQCTGDMQTELVFADEKCLPDAKDKYIYPVVPDMEEWSVASSEKREKFMQLPTGKLKSLSTFALLQSLLDKPLLQLDYLSSGNISPIGTCYKIYSSHNSIPAFEGRKDAVSALMMYYEAICFDCLRVFDFEARGKFSIQLTILEILFTREKILRQLDTAQKKQVVVLLLEKCRRKQDERIGINGSLAAMAWIMYEDKYLPVIAFYGSGELSNEWFAVYGDQENDIILFAENYTN